MTSIAYADLKPGMQVTAIIDYTATGASGQMAGVIVSVTDRCVIFDTGDSAPNPAWVGADQAVSFDQTGGAAITPEPSAGTILVDEAGATWQRLTGGWYSINGELTTWAGFLSDHPTYTVMQDTPATVLPDPPPAGYPVTIGPGDARLGMDVRVTVTYDTGGSRVVRGVCPWVQQNPPPDDAFPSFLFMPNIGGAQIVAAPDVIDAYVTNNPDAQAQISGRYVVQYDPLPAGITLLVEQMQDWTADSVWDISGTPEPPTGSIVRSKTGIAWQRTGDATADGDWYKTGDGLWSSVTGDFPRSFLWLWGAAAPFNLQEATP